MNKERMMKMFNLTEEEFNKSKLKYDSIIEPIFRDVFHEFGIIDKNIKTDKDVSDRIRKEMDEMFK